MPRLKLSSRLLEHLDFGTPSAERDIGRGLEKCFVESAAYQRVESGAKTIVLGNRGAGKSAIFQMLARRERIAGNNVIELSPDDYSYELLSQTLATERMGSWAKQGAYAAAWKYLIYVLVMKEIAKKGMRLTRNGGADIHRFIRDNYATGQLGPMSLLVSYLKRLEGVKLGPLEAGIRTRELDRLYKLEEVHDLLPSLRNVLNRRRVSVFVDELDRGWDSSEDAQAFVAGLFQACVSINELHPNLRVYVSLRQELYDDIPALYDDAQKHRDLLERIHWTEDSLLELIAKRIRHSARERGYDGEALDRVDAESCWAAVFSHLPGGQRTSSFGYMVDRTLYRPREIIQFCTEVQRAALGRSMDLPIPLAAIARAERGYSSERARDIAAEYRFQYPGLMSVFEVFRGRGPTFARDDLEMLCLELATGEIPTRDTSSWLDDRDPDSLIEILWQVGFLTAEGGAAPRGRATGASNGAGDGPFLGAHQAQYLNLATAKRFQVHPMFRSCLGIEEEPAGAAM